MGFPLPERDPQELSNPECDRHVHDGLHAFVMDQIESLQCFSNSWVSSCSNWINC
jgi:hypothetical protein